MVGSPFHVAATIERGGAMLPPRGVIPRDPTREPNGTFGSGPSSPTGGQVWFRIGEEAIGRMPSAPAARAWSTPSSSGS